MHTDPVSSGPYLLFHPNLLSFLSDTLQTRLTPDVCNCLALSLGSSVGYSLPAHPLWLVTPPLSFSSQNGWLHPQGSLLALSHKDWWNTLLGSYACCCHGTYHLLFYECLLIGSPHLRIVTIILSFLVRERVPNSRESELSLTLSTFCDRSCSKPFNMLFSFNWGLCPILSTRSTFL